jgi:hypothetical protein
MALADLPVLPARTRESHVAPFKNPLPVQLGGHGRKAECDVNGVKPPIRSHREMAVDPAAVCDGTINRSQKPRLPLGHAKKLIPQRDL